MLKFKPFRISAHWEWVDPDTQYKILAPNKETLINRIVTYRQQNELEPIFNLETVLEHYLCTKPYNSGICEPNKLHRSLSMYLKGGIALLKSLAYNSFAPQEEADRRSGICLTCPKNVFPDKSQQFVIWADRLAEASVGDRKSVNHDKLGNCAVCSCPLRAKVFYNGDLDFSPKELKAFPDFCWQKQLYDTQKSK